MQRPFPCFVCAKTETAIAFAQDPWCSDDCHKRLTRRLSIHQWHLTGPAFESAMRRLAKQDEDSLEFTVFTLNQLAEEIQRGRNGVEVYGSEELLREAERPGNWRDTDVPSTISGWVVPAPF